MSILRVSFQTVPLRLPHSVAKVATGSVHPTAPVGSGGTDIVVYMMPMGASHTGYVAH